jgi:GntR family transcriptional repressor for pyruvate dehydrogenase complex
VVRPIEPLKQQGSHDPNDADAGPPERAVAADLVVHFVRGLIESGQISAGDKLPPERELATLVGVSRPSVRAGLQSLAAVGAVEARRGAGTFVSSGPPLLESNPLPLFAALHGIGDSAVYETRRVIEIDLAGLAAERATDEQVIKISDEIMEMLAARDDPQRFLVFDIRFHRAVALAAGNPLLFALLEMVAELFYDLRRKTVYRWRGADEASEQHRRIYRAIRDRDPERARTEMDAHLRWAELIQQREGVQEAIRRSVNEPEQGGVG